MMNFQIISKQKMVWLFLIIIFVFACSKKEKGGIDGLDRNMEKIKYLTIAIESPKYLSKASLASGSNVLRKIIQKIPEVEELRMLGNLAGEYLANRINIANLQGNWDFAICCYAYILEKLNYKPSVLALVEFIKTNHLDESLTGTEGEFLFAPDFVTHTLKIITLQKDINDQYFSYTIEERKNAIQEAEKWLLSNQ